MTLLILYVIAAMLFLILVLSLGFKPKFMSRINGAILFVTAALGVLFYGYGYWTLFRNLPQAVIRTLFSVFCMFLGRNEISAISGAPLLQHPLMQMLIYATHLLALYTTASAVIAAIGTRLVRTLFLILNRRGDLHLIYGVNRDSVDFGKALIQETSGVLVFVDSGSGEALDGNILRMGSLRLSDGDCQKPTGLLLRKIGLKPGSRHVSIYCLDENPTDNLRYAESLREVLEKGGIAPDQSSLTVLLENAAAGPSLQKDDQTYGYGSVVAIERADMLARLMIKTSPPWAQMTFDAQGLAKEHFEALVVGFGRTGQAVLRSLIANGQYAGSHFRATVVAQAVREKAGNFFYRYPGIQTGCDLEMLEDNARSLSFYSYLEQHCGSLKYVAVCTGDQKENQEIANELRAFLDSRNVYPEIMLCDPNGVRRLPCGDGRLSDAELFSTKVLCSQELDAMAMLLNHQYHIREGRTPLQDWAVCDYFSRMSCRASADFLDAFLLAAGTDRETISRTGWQLSDAQMEHLSQMEHLRWCAFHLTMGYRPMPEDVYHRRAQQYLTEMEQSGHSSIRIGKDTVEKLHACLIPWEELDQLSRRETEVTGVPVDYKELDRDNVRLIPDMLKQSEK